MTMTLTQAVITVAAVVLGTMTTRFLPFILFPEGRKTPAYIQYLGKVLPFAVIGLLVVYCLKDVSFLTAPFGIPELLGIAVTAALHLWTRNMLISISGLTVNYMVLIQVI